MVAERGEGVGGEVSTFELLEEQDVGLIGAQPVGNDWEASLDGVDVPACEFDGGASGVREEAARFHRVAAGGVVLNPG